LTFGTTHYKHEEAALRFDESMVKARVAREIDPQGIASLKAG
jgi:hypothetical protein